MPGMTLKDHARAAIQLLSPQVEHRRVYTHLGWRQIGEAWCYLHAGGAIGVHGAVEDITVAPGQALAAITCPPVRRCSSTRSIPSPSARRGSRRGNHPGVCHLWGRSWATSIAVCIWWSPTGQGKSEIAALIQQHWGAAMDARHLPASWLSTGNALEGIAFQAKDAVLVVDDFCPAGVKADIARQHKEADRLLRAQGNRSGRRACVRTAPSDHPSLHGA